MTPANAGLIVALASTVVIPSDLDEARKAEDQLLEEVARHGYDEAALFAIKLAVEEGINNAIKHGNKHDRAKAVEISFDVGPERAEVIITDEGDGFALGEVADPTDDENLEKPTGRGIMLMRAYMDEVRYNDKGNRVHMVKIRP
jgi:serine/threonine-protein kinase RsbW